MRQKKKTTAFHLPDNSKLMGTGTITPDMSEALQDIRHLSGPPEKIRAKLDSAVASLLTAALLQLEQQTKS